MITRMVTVLGKAHFVWIGVGSPILEPTAFCGSSTTNIVQNGVCISMQHRVAHSILVSTLEFLTNPCVLSVYRLGPRVGAKH